MRPITMLSGTSKHVKDRKPRSVSVWARERRSRASSFQDYRTSILRTACEGQNIPLREMITRSFADDGSDSTLNRANGLRRAFQSPHTLAKSPLANFSGLAVGGRRKSTNPSPVEQFVLSNFEAASQVAVI